MPEPVSRIALIHATPVAMSPIHTAFQDLWPEAETFDLLESALSVDAVSYPDGVIDFDARFLALSRYARDVGAEGVLFSCSAFGSHIEKSAQALAPLPIMKPNEAMFAAALAETACVGMIATYEPAIREMRADFETMARTLSPGATLTVVMADGALDALRFGDVRRHDTLCAQAACEIVDADVLLLAHFSTSRARDSVSEATGLPVLTSPHSAVRTLKRHVASNLL